MASIRPNQPIKPLALTHERRRQSNANMEAQQQDPLLVSLRKSTIVPIPLGHAPTSPGLSASLSSSPSDTISSSPPTTSLDELSRMSSMSSTAAPSDQLFDASLISADVAKSFPEGYTVRPLTKGDYKKGFLDVLRVLTTVGDISEQRWLERFDYMKKREGDYYLIVVEDGSGKIVGTGAVIVERKFIHDLGLVGHIEDISVAKDQQGKKLGLRIIETLDNIAKRVGCYKSILDCSEANEGFYVKCGYKRAGLEMSHYY